MSKRVNLSLRDVLCVMRHLADVATLKNAPPAQRQHLIDGLNKLIGTDSSFFYVADDWRASKSPRFTHQTISSDHDKRFLRYLAEFGIQFPLDDDPFSYHALRDRAKMRTWTHQDVLPTKASAKQHPVFMDLRTSGRVADGVVSFFRTGANDDRIIGVGMHRFGQRPRLTIRQVAMVELAVSELRGLIERGAMFVASANPDPPLPSRLQQVLDRLLAGQTPKIIARQLGLSIWTVREYIQRLYKHFKVSGREELMAKFVGADGDGHLP